MFIRTDSSNPHFIELVRKLDADLAVRDGDDHLFYAALNKAALLNHTIVFYENDLPVACGALRAFDEQAMEVKRMYTLPEYRGRGIAGRVLTALEAWAIEQGYSRTVLETGLKQPEAIALYTREGYERIPNYGKYEGVYNSVCFAKNL